ncbi:hypothetical protein [Actinopolyspora mortivallis]|uniref:hypothetical protein n=1 Tax=Actinopolyspora mortivallis TaxID=33906 RepID=UPI000380D19A|nr:hypothetical protein [Actinopolyspora mortivallis]
MTESQCPRWRERGLHWHAHVSATVTTTPQRRHHTPDAVVFTPQDGVAWLTETLAGHRRGALALRWNTPAPVNHRAECRQTAALAAGYPVEAIVLTTDGQLYLHLDPQTPLQCPHHGPRARSDSSPP